MKFISLALLSDKNSYRYYLRGIISDIETSNIDIVVYINDRIFEGIKINSNGSFNQLLFLDKGENIVKVTATKTTTNETISETFTTNVDIFNAYNNWYEHNTNDILSNFIAQDNLTNDIEIGKTQLKYQDANAGIKKPLDIDLSNISNFFELVGPNDEKYDISHLDLPTIYSAIVPKPLSVVITTPITKVYDGNDDVTSLVNELNDTGKLQYYFCSELNNPQDIINTITTETITEVNQYNLWTIYTIGNTITQDNYIKFDPQIDFSTLKVSIDGIMGYSDSQGNVNFLQTVQLIEQWEAEDILEYHYPKGLFTFIAKALREDVPKVDDIAKKSESIKGSGNPGSTIMVNFSTGESLSTLVDENGDWEIYIPETIKNNLKENDLVYIKQISKDTIYSPIVVRKVKNEIEQMQSISPIVYPLSIGSLTLNGEGIAGSRILVEYYTHEYNENNMLEERHKTIANNLIVNSENKWSLDISKLDVQIDDSFIITQIEKDKKNSPIVTIFPSKRNISKIPIIDGINEYSSIITGKAELNSKINIYIPKNIDDSNIDFDLNHSNNEDINSIIKSEDFSYHLSTNTTRANTDSSKSFWKLDLKDNIELKAETPIYFTSQEIETQSKIKNSIIESPKLSEDKDLYNNVIKRYISGFGIAGATITLYYYIDEIIDNEIKTTSKSIQTIVDANTRKWEFDFTDNNDLDKITFRYIEQEELKNESPIVKTYINLGLVSSTPTINPIVDEVSDIIISGTGIPYSILHFYYNEQLVYETIDVPDKNDDKNTETEYVIHQVIVNGSGNWSDQLNLYYVYNSEIENYINDIEHGYNVGVTQTEIDSEYNVINKRESGIASTEIRVTTGEMSTAPVILPLYEGEKTITIYLTNESINTAKYVLVSIGDITFKRKLNVKNNEMIITIPNNVDLIANQQVIVTLLDSTDSESPRAISTVTTKNRRRSKCPNVNYIDVNSKIISGTGIPKSTIEIIYEGKTLTSRIIVDNSGNWTYTKSIRTKLIENTELIFIQREPELIASPKVYVTIADKEISNAPSINAFTKGDKTISGKGINNSIINIYGNVSNNSEMNSLASTTVDSKGIWTADISNLYDNTNDKNTLDTLDYIYATQTEINKRESKQSKIQIRKLDSYNNGFYITNISKNSDNVVISGNKFNTSSIVTLSSNDFEKTATGSNNTWSITLTNNEINNNHITDLTLTQKSSNLEDINITITTISLENNKQDMNLTLFNNDIIPTNIQFVSDDYGTNENGTIERIINKIKVSANKNNSTVCVITPYETLTINIITANNVQELNLSTALIGGENISIYATYTNSNTLEQSNYFNMICPYWYQSKAPSINSVSTDDNEITGYISVTQYGYEDLILQIGEDKFRVLINSDLNTWNVPISTNRINLEEDMEITILGVEKSNSDDTDNNTNVKIVNYSSVIVKPAKSSPLPIIDDIINTNEKITGKGISNSIIHISTIDERNEYDVDFTSESLVVDESWEYVLTELDPDLEVGRIIYFTQTSPNINTGAMQSTSPRIGVEVREHIYANIPTLYPLIHLDDNIQGETFVYDESVKATIEVPTISKFVVSNTSSNNIWKSVIGNNSKNINDKTIVNVRAESNYQDSSKSLQTKAIFEDQLFSLTINPITEEDKNVGGIGTIYNALANINITDTSYKYSATINSANFNFNIGINNYRLDENDILTFSQTYTLDNRHYMDSPSTIIGVKKLYLINTLSIDEVIDGDMMLTGDGLPGANITLELSHFNNYDIIEIISTNIVVNDSKKWSYNLKTPIKYGDKIIVTQIKELLDNEEKVITYATYSENQVVGLNNTGDIPELKTFTTIVESEKWLLENNKLKWSINFISQNDNDSGEYLIHWSDALVGYHVNKSIYLIYKYKDNNEVAIYSEPNEHDDLFLYFGNKNLPNNSIRFKNKNVKSYIEPIYFDEIDLYEKDERVSALNYQLSGYLAYGYITQRPAKVEVIFYNKVYDGTVYAPFGKDPNYNRGLSNIINTDDIFITDTEIERYMSILVGKGNKAKQFYYISSKYLIPCFEFESPDVNEEDEYYSNKNIIAKQSVPIVGNDKDNYNIEQYSINSIVGTAYISKRPINFVLNRLTYVVSKNKWDIEYEFENEIPGDNLTIVFNTKNIEDIIVFGAQTQTSEDIQTNIDSYDWKSNDIVYDYSTNQFNSKYFAYSNTIDYKFDDVDTELNIIDITNTNTNFSQNTNIALYAKDEAIPIQPNTEVIRQNVIKDVYEDGNISFSYKNVPYFSSKDNTFKLYNGQMVLVTNIHLNPNNPKSKNYQLNTTTYYCPIHII